MKNIFLIITLQLFLLFNFSFSQEIQNENGLPYIEVVGHAEKKIVPDEIYLTIKIVERTEGRKKITIEEQEEALKKALLEIKIPLENLNLSDAGADYIRVKWTKKDVIAQSEYELKLKSAQEVALVLEKLDNLKIEKFSISRVTHSKIKEFRKQTEIEAITMAKNKADYLLEAIGQKTGSALEISERSNALPSRNSGRRYYRNAEAEFSYTIPKSKFENIIQFKKIKLTVNIYVKFEVK